MKRNDELATTTGDRHVDGNEALLLRAFEDCAERDRGIMQVLCIQLARVSGLERPRADQLIPLYYYLEYFHFPKHAIDRVIGILEGAALQPADTGAVIQLGGAK